MSKEKLETGTHTADHSPRCDQILDEQTVLRCACPRGHTGPHIAASNTINLYSTGGEGYTSEKPAGEADHSRRAEMPPVPQDVLSTRCMAHRYVPQMNASEASGAECAACATVALGLRWVMALVEYGYGKEIAYAGEPKPFVAAVFAAHLKERLDKVLPDSLNRGLEERIASLLERADRESKLAVKLAAKCPEYHSSLAWDGKDWQASPEPRPAPPPLEVQDSEMCGSCRGDGTTMGQTCSGCQGTGIAGLNG